MKSKHAQDTLQYFLKTYLITISHPEPEEVFLINHINERLYERRVLVMFSSAKYSLSRVDNTRIFANIDSMTVVSK